MARRPIAYDFSGRPARLFQESCPLAAGYPSAQTGGYGGAELLEGDLTALALSFPVAYAPGETWIYSTLDTQLIPVIVQAAVGTSLADFARGTRFDALGVDKTEWWADGIGTTIGGQNLSMIPRDMAKLGLLYLHNGVWEGEQLLIN